jgi:DNA-binding NtrC family response regulator
LVLDGTDGHVIMLPDAPSVTIGRGKDADIRIDEPSLSRVHARLGLGAHITLEDLGSSNGTRIGGVRLTPGNAVLVPPGAPIELGGVVVVVHVGRGNAASVLSSTSGSAEGAKALERTIMRVAQSELAVLLVGETGVGKGKLARDVHDRSRHAKGAFVVAPCIDLAEAYGRGVIESARGGTLVLDEITETHPNLQPELTHTIEELAGDTRIISTSREDLVAAVASGRVRPELYHRINGIAIVVPPLRARIREIAELALELAARAARAAGRPPPVLAPDALVVLERHRWPGNVRELGQAMERALTLCRGRVITASHLVGLTETPAAPVYGVPLAVSPATGGRSALQEAREEAEYRRIVEALRACRGNQTKAAKALGISRGTLIARLERYNVPRPRKA